MLLSMPVFSTQMTRMTRIYVDSKRIYVDSNPHKSVSSVSSVC
jgi:hypothetical protein